jgi:hypothetical protein
MDLIERKGLLAGLQKDQIGQEIETRSTEPNLIGEAAE